MSRYIKIVKKLYLVAINAVILISLSSMFVSTSSFANEKKLSSIDKAVHEIRMQTKGKIISADDVTVDEVTKHRIKVLMPNGHVKVFYKPAQ